MTLKPLHLGLALSPTWLRGGSWRRVDSRIEEYFSVDFYADVAHLAERATLDFLFKPDALMIDPTVVTKWPGFSSPDPTVLLAALTRETKHIGLVTTISTTFVPPFLIARQLQSLHHASAGRAGWNVVMSLDGQRLFGSDAMPESAARYAKATEVLDVVHRLWASFPCEAIVADRDSGRYADPTLLRPVAHAGEHVTLSGVNTLPQHRAGRVPIFQAGDSEAGRNFAARTADAVFALNPDLAAGVALRADLRARAAQFSRRPEDIRVLPGVRLFLGASAAAAQQLVEDSRAASPSTSGREQAGARHWTIVGTPRDAVREIAERAEAGALDGIIALPSGSWESLRLFTDEVVPRLVDVGLARGEYKGATLAEHLGISVSADFSTDGAAGP